MCFLVHITLVSDKILLAAQAISSPPSWSESLTLDPRHG